jgi:hypothetical protein
MQELAFDVQGSSKKPYKVEFVLQSPDKLSAYCNCMAGSNGQYCKHRLGILAGDGAHVVSDNKEAISTVQEWLKGTELEVALNKMYALEKGGKETKQEFMLAKKAVARLMRD